MSSILIGEKTMGVKKLQGKRRTVWLPSSLDQKAEQTRKRLGLGLSGFYRFAIVETIKDMERKVNQDE